MLHLFIECVWGERIPHPLRAHIPYDVSPRPDPTNEGEPQPSMRDVQTGPTATDHGAAESASCRRG